MKYLFILGILVCTGCGFRIPGISDFKPLTLLTDNEWAIINKIEERVKLAKIEFNQPYFKTYLPRITVVRSPDQHISRFNCMWKDVPKWYPGYPERVKGEGYSGLWVGPDLFVSRIGDRDNDKTFRSLYAHERSHTFFQRGSGHPDLFWKIEKFLLKE